MLPIAWTDILQGKSTLQGGLKRLLWPFFYLLSVGLPNQLTVLRFFIGILFFLVLPIRLYDLALALFLIALITDFLDGYLARKKGLVSSFGRIADPFADKMIICGGLIAFISHTPPLVEPWMVAVVVGRELVVSTLRGFAELRGIAFPSSHWGKTKMGIQSFTLGVLLFSANHLVQYYWVTRALDKLLWFMVILTALSGLPYLYNAWQVFKKDTNYAKSPHGLL